MNERTIQMCKKKKNRNILYWRHRILNHCYYVHQKYPKNREKATQYLLSILPHITGRHRFRKVTKYPENLVLTVSLIHLFSLHLYLSPDPHVHPRLQMPPQTSSHLSLTRDGQGQSRMAGALLHSHSSGLPRSLCSGLHSQEHELERIVPLVASSLSPEETSCVSETYSEVVTFSLPRSQK